MSMLENLAKIFQIPNYVNIASIFQSTTYTLQPFPLSVAAK